MLNRTLTRLWRDEKGIALPLALMALVVLASLSAALLATGGAEVQIATNHLHGIQAFFLAEAGLEQAFAALLATPTAITTLAGLPANGTLAGGAYTLTYQAAGTSTVLVVSTGTIGNAQRILKATLTNGWKSEDAVRVEKDLTISGNPTVEGNCGRVHTNEDLDISGGSVVISGTATATGTVVSGHDRYRNTPRGARQTAQGGQARRDIPAISAAELLELAKADATASQALYWLKNDGTVAKWNPSTRAFDTLIGAALNAIIKHPSNPQGWEVTQIATVQLHFSTQPARWVIGAGGGGAPTGTFYVDGDITISGDVGPWTATLIAADTQPATTPNQPGNHGGDINISGNPEITPHMANTLLVADRDIEISGNPHGGRISYQGYIMAQEQIKVNGNPTINGAILAKDAANLSDFVTADSISGDPTIAFDCSDGPPLTGNLRALTWGS